jgi:HEAT repeat protein
MAHLARELGDLAARRDAAGLAARFARLPLRDILAVRAVIVARGEHRPLVDALLEGLASGDSRVRHDCAHALDHFADERCVAPLRRLLADPVPRVRRMALHVLSCDGCKLTPLPAADDLVARVIHSALADPSINVRRHATVALGGCRTAGRAVEVLEALAVHDADPAVRREARRALRRLDAAPPA